MVSDTPVTLSTQFSSALIEEKQIDIDETAKLLESKSPKQLAKKGLAIINLSISSLKTGMGGRTIMTLELDPAYSSKGQDIQLGDIRTGDIVRVSPLSAATDSKKKGSQGKAKKPVSSSKSNESAQLFVDGVVSINAHSLSIAVDETFSDTVPLLPSRLWIVKLTNIATYKRMEFALKGLETLKDPTRIQSILLGNTTPSIPASLPQLEFFDTTLNDPQKEAVRFAMSSSEVTLIHGPPGTGKTYTLIEIVRQLIKQKKRVLICGPSNISVDNIVERLHPHMKDKDKLIRIGHPARLLQSTRSHALDIVSKSSEHSQVIREIQQEIDQNLGKISKTKSGMERRKIYGDIKELRKDYRQREAKVLTNIISAAAVVVSTLHGAGSYSLRNAKKYKESSKPLFDALIIDEVSQSLEPQCWIPIIDFPDITKLIVAGDNKQLPPVVMTKSIKYQKILERTLFDRVEKFGFGKDIIKLLPIQYRMNKLIMEFPSKMMYQNKLIADKSVADIILSDYPHVEKTEETESPVVWIDTQGDDFPEAANDEDDKSQKDKLFEFSKSNENEAYLVRNYAYMLVEKGVDPSTIGIIAPYSAQISIISQIVHEKYPTIEIATVDGFQGREKDVIILSLVRSNEKGEVGFLGEERRLNVAMTRPKRHLCIVGNSETISRGSKFLKEWVKWGEDNAYIQFPDISEVLQSQ